MVVIILLFCRFRTIWTYLLLTNLSIVFQFLVVFLLCFGFEIFIKALDKEFHFLSFFLTATMLETMKSHVTDMLFFYDKKVMYIGNFRIDNLLYISENYNKNPWKQF